MQIKASRLFGIKNYSTRKLRGPAFLLDTKTLDAVDALMPNEFLRPSISPILTMLHFDPRRHNNLLSRDGLSLKHFIQWFNKADFG